MYTENPVRNESWNKNYVLFVKMHIIDFSMLRVTQRVWLHGDV